MTDKLNPAPWGEAELETLRESIRGRMSGKRLTHTLAVERMAARMGDLLCPEQTWLLRAAALLHDVTKELTTEAQVALCERLGLPVAPEDLLAPKCFHARTAAALIPMEYPAFGHPLVISAVRYHTTGRADMALEEKIIYLADYIDDSRTFPECVALRNLFWDAHPEDMAPAERPAHLDRVVLTSFDMTIDSLLREGVPISPDTFLARNSLLLTMQSKHRKE